MEVILIESVRNLGKIGEIFKVKNGFARNYLIPRGIAIKATDANKSFIEEQKHALEEKDKQNKENAAKINMLIQGKELVFIKQSADDKKLFGSVTNKEIAEKLSKIAGSTIHPVDIILNKQIKTLGLFEIEVKLHPELTASIIVIVARSDSEAQNYIKERSAEKNTSEEDNNIA